MPKYPQEFADLLGAKVVGEVPEVGCGPFGMARLAHLMYERLTPGQGERPEADAAIDEAVRELTEPLAATPVL